MGRDARGRKQYRYHARWREIRDEAKYGKMLVFGRKLPAIRARVERDLGRPGLPREKVLAALVRLLERTLARIGNEEYARANNSFGLTTLRHRHANTHGAVVELDFRAKHGIQRHIELKDRKLANIVRKLQDIPGQELFHYIDDDGMSHTVGSDDVNAYLHEITGENITAKDFRTWAATNLAALALREFEVCDSEAKAKKNVLRAVEAVAGMLGNTPSICRKCYIHPAIFDGYLDGSLLEGLKARADDVLDGAAPGLTAEEIAVTAFLDRKLGMRSVRQGTEASSPFLKPAAWGGDSNLVKRLACLAGREHHVAMHMHAHQQAHGEHHGQHGGAAMADQRQRNAANRYGAHHHRHVHEHIHEHVDRDPQSEKPPILMTTAQGDQHAAQDDRQQQQQ